jgi:hypothetical protein
MPSVSEHSSCYQLRPRTSNSRGARRVPHGSADARSWVFTANQCRRAQAEHIRSSAVCSGRPLPGMSRYSLGKKVTFPLAISVRVWDRFWSSFHGGLTVSATEVVLVALTAMRGDRNGAAGIKCARGWSCSSTGCAQFPVPTSFLGRRTATLALRSPLPVLVEGHKSSPMGGEGSNTQRPS